jgi:murein DD-endopeptidase MepM/ murein hydrolase activator NlpD
MKRVLVVVAIAAVAIPAEAGTKFRVPLSLLSTQCGGGRCYPTAYYDTNRSTSYRRDWACHAKTYNQHSGTDLGIGGFSAMDQGRWVMAAASGTVIAAHDGEYDRCTSGHCGTANYIKIRHSDGRVSLYWHLKKWSVRVKVGQRVSCGTVIGKVGSSGYATGPHLHFGDVTSTGAVVDPYGAVSSGCGNIYGDWTHQGSWGGLPGNTCQ